MYITYKSSSTWASAFDNLSLLVTGMETTHRQALLERDSDYYHFDMISFPTHRRLLLSSALGHVESISLLSERLERIQLFYPLRAIL